MAQILQERSTAPVRLSMLNLDSGIDNNGQSPRTPDSANDNNRKHPLNNTRQAHDHIRQYREEIALCVHVHDDNNRINERDPTVCLNYLLLKQWCMMNALEMYDIDNILG